MTPDFGWYCNMENPHHLQKDDEISHQKQDIIMLNNIVIMSLVYMSFLHYIVYFHPLHCIFILLHYIVGI